MPKTLALIVSSHCNLRCSYCYCSLSENTKVDMSLDTALSEISKGYDKVTFFGDGEPLLRFDTMQEVVRAYPLVRYSIVTNGTLITKEIAKWFKDNNVKVQLSIDGDRPLQVKQRGLPSLCAIDNIDILNGEGVIPSIRSTVSYDSVYGGYHILDVIKFHSVLFRAGKIENAHWSNDNYNEINNCIYKELDDSYEWLVEERKGGRPVIWKTFYRYLKGYKKGWKRSPHTCGAGRSYMTLKADGTLTGCHRLIEGCDKPEFLDIPDCSGCEIQGICAGGCRAMSTYFNGCASKHLLPLCNLERYIAMLARRYNENNSNKQPSSCNKELPDTVKTLRTTNAVKLRRQT